ncbi:hypothetical protein GCM10012286_28770 [Streptomyces lasiicapitis]|uniref:Uncharacterized protein n=1 Tax=Streptomyces lasiicapitis TaxID=1923961 RepID=A0ABQ2LW68_9ACTN|nr:hypothetical protein GCM10012286_28770 [Streptomyces lasiicapitis]
MRRGASSDPSVRARLWTAAFVAEYTDATDRPRCRVQEALMTMAPPSLSSGNVFCTVKKTPLKLVSTVWSKSASVNSVLALKTPAPALAKTASRPPRQASTLRARRSRSGSEVTSARTVRIRSAPVPSASSAAAAASRRARSRPVITTYAPSSRNLRAAAYPMPLVPPVIRTVLFVNRFMGRSSCGDGGGGSVS